MLSCKNKVIIFIHDGSELTVLGYPMKATDELRSMILKSARAEAEDDSQTGHHVNDLRTDMPLSRTRTSQEALASNVEERQVQTSL